MVILDGGQRISTSSEGIAPRTSVDYQWLSYNKTYNKTYNKRIDPYPIYSYIMKVNLQLSVSVKVMWQ